MKTQSITVAGRSFKIKSDADQKYLQNLASTISKRFESLARNGTRQDQDLKVMAMVAIGLLDELNESDKRYQDVRTKAKSFTAKMVEKIDSLLSAKSL